MRVFVQPVTLTVGNETQLLLSAWRDPQDTGHTIYAQLVDGLGNPLPGQNVGLTVNGTSYALPPTNGTGYVTLHLALQPGDTGANTYQVIATFNGTNPRSFSINASDPYGDQYAVCTTTQYDLRPATNSSTLAVLLQTTDAITAAKTMEQMQKDAKSSGWFGMSPEFTLFYPWFRLHYKLNVNLPQGNPELDYGWSPLLFGESSSANSTALASIMNATTEGENPEKLATFFAAIAVPFIIQATVCYTLGYGPWAIAIATLAYGVFLATYTLSNYEIASGNPNALLMQFMSVAFVEMASLFVVPSGFVGVANLLSTAARLVLGEIQCPLQALHALKMGFFAITTAIFALMDFAVMVFFLSMYLRSIQV